MKLRDVRGLVQFRMKSYVLKDGSRKAGAVITKLYDEPPRPISRMVEAWRTTGTRWSEDFGGRFLEMGTRELKWEWFDDVP